MKIIAGSSSRALAGTLSAEMDVPLASTTIKRFPDGECYVRINEKINEAIIVQNTYPDSSIIELFLLQDAAVKMGAKRIRIVIPYYGYGRQDRTFEEGEAVSSEKMAHLIEQNADSVILVNPHKPHITNFFSIDAGICDGMPSIAEYFEGRVDAVISPDKGALEMAKKAAGIIKCGYDYFEKTRISGSEVKMEVKDMDVKGKSLLIMDDIISTGGTMAKAVEMLNRQGAERIYAACIHGLFIKNADKRIMNAGCSELASTDTIESIYSRASVAREVAKLLE
ncbi:MAG: ribose-phosphate diphosphokinase [Thermoplasmata archaeon]|nr:ribose-phosphate diphosphokinase [Thermoplasmata archaeon]